MQVNIIGAGVAGLSSALSLANADIKTNLFEQSSFVGSGGDNFQAVRNYDLEKDFVADLRDKGVKVTGAKPITKIIKYAPSGKSMISESPNSNPLFYVFRRGNAGNDSLDIQLFNQASAKGVNFMFNERRTLTAGDIIAVGPIFRNVWGYGAVFEGVDVDDKTIHLFMDNNYAPRGGYVYAIPFGKDKLTVAAMTFDLNSPLPSLFEKFLKDNKVVSGLIQNCYKKTYFGGYSYSNVPKSAKIKDKIFVGSAAGFVEAARGFGVSYGINSGLMAAEAIIENKDYDLLWKSSFEKELLKGLKRRFFFEKLNNSDFEKMVLADKAKISKSTKVPFELVDLFEGIAFNKELAKWNNKFSIGRIF